MPESQEVQKLAKAMHILWNAGDPNAINIVAIEALKLARDGYNQENLKFQLSRLQTNRLGMRLDIEACEKIAKLTIEIANA